jgi:hypothetical protein
MLSTPFVGHAYDQIGRGIPSSVRSDVVSQEQFNTEEVSSARESIALLKEGNFLIVIRSFQHGSIRAYGEEYYGLGQSPGSNTHSTISVRRS